MIQIKGTSTINSNFHAKIYNIENQQKKNTFILCIVLLSHDKEHIISKYDSIYVMNRTFITSEK